MQSPLLTQSDYLRKLEVMPNAAQILSDFIGHRDRRLGCVIRNHFALHKLSTGNTTVLTDLAVDQPLEVTE